jgi:hypothetical protein
MYLYVELRPMGTSVLHPEPPTKNDLKRFKNLQIKIFKLEGDEVKELSYDETWEEL